MPPMNSRRVCGAHAGFAERVMCPRSSFAGIPVLLGSVLSRCEADLIDKHLDVK
jgi:hypothetical protein